MPPTPSSTIFARYPAALSLPTADPSGLAVEVMLRIINSRASRRDARLGDLSLTIHDPGAAAASSAEEMNKETVKPEVCKGLMPCLKRLSSEDGVAQLADSQAAEVTCVEVLTTQCVFPAFLFAVHFDPVVYRCAILKSVEPKVASFWEGLTCGYRTQVLRSNPYWYTGLGVLSLPKGQMTLEHIAKLKEVGESLVKAFAALEKLCAAKSTSAETFFMGTSKPTYVDALVYAATSSVFHADFGETAVVLRAFQRQLTAACPQLLQYTERLRQLFFEADSGTYCLKPHSAGEEDPAVAVTTAAERQFRKGRWQTLWWTGTFATFYFVFSNADLVLALLEGMAGEAAEANAQEAETAPREPREL